MQTSARHKKQLERWKSNAKVRQERLARVLSKEPKDINKALRREARLRIISQRLVNRGQWLDAYREHNSVMGSLIEKAVAKLSSVVAAQAPNRAPHGEEKHKRPSRKHRK